MNDRALIYFGLLLPLEFGILLFLSLALLALAKASNTMLNESGESWHLCLVLDLREKTVFSTSLL